MAEEEELRRRGACDLAAEFTADGAAGAGDKDALAPDHADHLVGLDLHRLPAQ